jgi:3-phosphoshikimate 1-carboxyvinyltransferase
MLSARPVGLLPEVTFKTYNDHRMAMSLAPLAILGDEVIIDDPGVVRKSYPRFWDDLREIGFEVGPPVKEAVAA